MERDYITRHEAASILGVNVRTVDRCLLNGSLTKYMRRWRVYLDRAEVVRLAEVQPVAELTNVS